MSTAVHVPGDVPSSYTSGRPREYALEDENEDNTTTINEVEALQQGIIKTPTTKAKAPYTILLVGETGVGKSSVFELIANVLAGNDIDHYNFNVLDLANEQGGSNNQSQTNSARFYQLTSNNGIVVRILDTPGLADTRGLQQDELHKKSIATQIKKHVDSITAVLVLANGSVPRITAGTDFALSTLSAIFNKSLASNIAFMFTNVMSPLHWNFSRDTVPEVLKDAPHFLLNNPIALQRKLLRLKDGTNTKTRWADLRKSVKDSEENALEVLVDLFDWLDSLEPRPTTEIVPLYEEPQDIRTMSGDSRPDGSSGGQDGNELCLNQKPTSNLNLEQRYVGMEEKEVSRKPQGRMQANLGQMKGRLELLRVAEEKVQGGIRKVKRIFIG